MIDCVYAILYVIFTKGLINKLLEFQYDSWAAS